MRHIRIHKRTHIVTDNETRDIQIDRSTQTQTQSQPQGQTERQADRDRQAHTQNGKYTDAYRERHAVKQWGQADTQTQIETNRQTGRYRATQSR